MGYDIDEHRHRFAVWAAARAVQRGFSANIVSLRKSLDECGVRKYLRDSNDDKLDADQFDDLHKEWCDSIVQTLKESGCDAVTFGRAAKLVAIYLKTVVVLGKTSDSAFARHAHPPIDRILLQRLTLNSHHRSSWRTITWTALKRDEYYDLVEQLRGVLRPNEPFWMLEQYWTVTKDKGE